MKEMQIKMFLGLLPKHLAEKIADLHVSDLDDFAVNLKDLKPEQVRVLENEYSRRGILWPA